MVNKPDSTHSYDTCQAETILVLTFRLHLLEDHSCVGRHDEVHGVELSCMCMGP